MKRYLPGILALVLLIFFCNQGHAKDMIKILYLDSQRILYESLAGKDAYSTLQSLKDAKQMDIDKMQGNLQSLGQDISVKSPTMNESAREELEMRYEQQLKRYNRFVKDAQEELRRKEVSLVKPISEEVNVIIKEYGNKNNVDIIMDRRDPGIIYTSKDLDITDAILELFDKKYMGMKEKKE